MSENMQNYIRTTVYQELLRKRCNEGDAKTFVENFISNPQCREELIEEWELDTIRICEHCGQPMCEGYMVNDFLTFCSEECARAATTEMGWPEGKFDYHISNGDEEDDTIYWKQWEG